MSHVSRRTITAPAAPRWLRPRLSREARRQLAIVQLQKLWDLDTGRAASETLWDLVRDAYTWLKVAELIGAGQAEMGGHLEVVTRMAEHYGRTGRVEFTSHQQAEAVRLACAWMEDLAELVDHETAKAAAAWSEQVVGELQAADEQRRAA